MRLEKVKNENPYNQYVWEIAFLNFSIFGLFLGNKSSKWHLYFQIINILYSQIKKSNSFPYIHASSATNHTPYPKKISKNRQK